MNGKLSPDSSAARRPADPRAHPGHFLDLFGQCQRPPRRLLSSSLLLLRPGITHQQLSSQFVVMSLIRLDYVAVKSRRLVITGRFTKVYEQLISDQGYTFASELTGSYSLGSSSQ